MMYLIVYLLNLLDLVFTLVAINNGAYELNPLFSSISFMFFYKVIIIGIATMLLKKINNRLCKTLTVTLIGIYSILVVYHLTAGFSFV